MNLFLQNNPMDQGILYVVDGAQVLRYSEVAIRRCSVKKVFLEISQSSQENTCT